MDLTLSFLSGVSIKVYDDLVDNTFKIKEFYAELLKVFLVISLSVLSVRDFNFSMFFLLMNILSFVADNELYLTNNFHTSISVLYPILVVLSFQTRKSLNLVSILYIGCFLVFFAVEPILIKEEYSHRKFIIRILTSIVVFIGLFVGQFFGVSWSFLKIGTISLGYIFASSVFQLYMLSQNNDSVLQTNTLHI